MMKKIVFMTVMLACISLTGCSEKKQNASSQPVSVEVQAMKSADVTAGYDYVGTVEETTGAMLSFEVPGNVERIAVDAGTRVRRGQLLATLNQASLKDMYDAAAATLTQARDAYARYSKLHQQGSMPEIKWVEVESKLQQAVSAEAIAKKNLNDSRLYAPYDGVIASKEAEQGMNVLAGQPVLKLVDVRQVSVKIAVPEKEIARLKVGQKAMFRVEALDGRSYQTQVTEKGIVANQLSHTYEVKMKVDNADGALMPGMVCNVSVVPDFQKSGFTLPAGAVSLDVDGRRFVWTVVDGKAARRWVETGALAGNNVAITSGLSEGDMVITVGNHKVSEGMEVNVK